MITFWMKWLSRETFHVVKRGTRKQIKPNNHYASQLSKSADKTPHIFRFGFSDSDNFQFQEEEEIYWGV